MLQKISSFFIEFVWIDIVPLPGAFFDFTAYSMPVFCFLSVTKTGLSFGENSFADNMQKAFCRGLYIFTLPGSGTEPTKWKFYLLIFINS